MRANLGSVLVRQNKFQSSLMHCFVIHLKIMRQRCSRVGNLLPTRIVHNPVVCNAAFLPTLLIYETTASCF